MRSWLPLLVAVPAIALGQPVASSSNHFQAQAFLAGHCWKGTFPDGKQVDEHCFEWVYGGQYLRDRHTVVGGPSPYGGETIYYFDSGSKLVRYLYINALGGNSQGTVTVKDGSLIFPEETYTEGKQQQTYRSSWRRDGDDAYLVLTEMKSADGWKEAWHLRMQRQK